MAQFTDVPTQNTGDTWTAANANTYWRDNFSSIRPDLGLASDTDAITISNSTDTIIPWANIIVDTGSFFSTDQPTKLTFPYAGAFLVHLQTDWAANSSGTRRIALFRSGSTTYELETEIDAMAGGQPTTVRKQEITHRAVADYWEVVVFQDSGGNLDITHFQINIATLINNSTA